MREAVKPRESKLSMDEMDLTINSFLGDSKKMIPHLYG